MNRPPYSEPILKWITLAERELYHGRDDDSWLIADNETHYYLHQVDGRYRLTTSDRNGPRRFLLHAPDMTAIERYLTRMLGIVIRANRKLPHIYAATTIDDLRPGWTITRTPSAEQYLQYSDGSLHSPYDPEKHLNLTPEWTITTPPHSHFLVKDPQGYTRALFADDHAIQFSWIANESLEDLHASYLNPDGLPLFPHGWIGPPGKEPDHASRAWENRPDEDGS